MGTLTGGILILIVCLPAAIPIHRSPEVLGLSPDGRSHNDNSSQKSGLMHPKTGDSDFTIREALQTRTYWMLTGAISLRLFVTMALNAHLVPILVWRGISEEAAAYYVSLCFHLYYFLSEWGGWETSGLISPFWFGYSTYNYRQLGSCL
jgi:hypothetical protein